MICFKFFSRMLLYFVMLSLIACSGVSQYEKNKKFEDKRKIGEAYMRQGNLTAALSELLEAEKLNPNDHILHNDLGLCYYGKERFDLSVIHLQKAIALKHDYTPAKNNLGVVYLKQKNWNAAITIFKEISDNLLYATPHFPLSNLGEAYYNLGDLKQAEYYYNESLKRKPNFPNALRGLGQTYLKMNRPHDAVSFLEKAIQSAPQSAAIYLDLADAYQAQQNRQKAVYSYEKVIELAPDSPLAREAELSLNRIKRGP